MIRYDGFFGTKSSGLILASVNRIIVKVQSKVNRGKIPHRKIKENIEYDFFSFRVKSSTKLNLKIYSVCTHEFDELSIRCK